MPSRSIATMALYPVLALAVLCLLELIVFLYQTRAAVLEMRAMLHYLLERVEAHEQSVRETACSYPVLPVPRPARGTET